jgi:hypothetical protein
VIWFACAAVCLLVVVALGVFALDALPVRREDLRVGVLSPHTAERLAAGKRNRALAVALLGFAIAVTDPYVASGAVVLFGYLVGVIAVIVLAWAAHYHHLVQLARDPECVISASPDRVVIDVGHQRPGRMRVTEGELARALGQALPKSTVIS